MSTPAFVTKAAAKYKATQVVTCSPGELLLLLMDGAIRFASEADQAMASGDRARAGERIGRCHAVVEELAAALDPKDTTGLCADLGALYAFCMQRLLEANLQQDREMLADVPRLIRTVREGVAQVLGKP
jgi:flagellar protein FliS